MINQWDHNAAKRHEQILKGLDFSFDNVLSPTFIKLVHGIEDIKMQNILDVGCGSGILTYRLSRLVGNIRGIDPSAKSIEIAKKEFGTIKNLEFLCNSIEDHQINEKYDVVVSNMTIQAIKNIKKVFYSISRLMNKPGTFIFSIPHPCFWIEYRKKVGLDEYKNYSYGRNSKYPITFSISNDRIPLPSHVPLYHRRIEYYSNQLNLAGFFIKRLLEPYPKEIEGANTNWETPHFLFFICSLTNYSGV